MFNDHKGCETGFFLGFEPGRSGRKLLKYPLRYQSSQIDSYNLKKSNFVVLEAKLLGMKSNANLPRLK